MTLNMKMWFKRLTYLYLLKNQLYSSPKSHKPILLVVFLTEALLAGFFNPNVNGMDELANTIQSRFHHLWRELSFANLLSNTSNSSENEEEGEDKDVASSFVNSHRTIVFNHEQVINKLEY